MISIKRLTKEDSKKIKEGQKLLYNGEEITVIGGDYRHGFLVLDFYLNGEKRWDYFWQFEKTLKE